MTSEALPSLTAGERRVETEGRAALLRDVCAALEEAGHHYCIMHGYTGYPDHIPSDVDLIAEAPLRIPHLLLRRGVSDIVQVLEHEANSFYFVLRRELEGHQIFLTVDAAGDFRRNGRIFLGGREVIRTSRPFAFFRIPSPEVEFAYSLIKRIGKLNLNATHAGRLGTLYRQAPSGCEHWIRVLFPPRDGDLIRQACLAGTWDEVGEMLPTLRRRMLIHFARQRPMPVVAYWAAEARRRARRLLMPTGQIVAFVGPDGVGKTTIMTEVERALAPAFRATRRYHARPHFGRPRSGTPVTDPHAQVPRGLLLSTAKIAWWWVDYTVSFPLDVLPRLARSTLLLFDRYYADILIDPRRYRYGGPMWLARLLSRLVFVGRPIVVCLDAPPDAIWARKREIPWDEIARQCEAYVRLVRQLPRGHVVDAARPISAVVADVTQIILAAMTARVLSRLGRRVGT